jgi:hypothetical protein
LMKITKESTVIFLSTSVRIETSPLFETVANEQ